MHPYRLPPSFTVESIRSSYGPSSTYFLNGYTYTQVYCHRFPAVNMVRYTVAIHRENEGRYQQWRNDMMLTPEQVIDWVADWVAAKNSGTA